MATEVNANGEPCRPSLAALWNSTLGDATCVDEETERISLDALDPAPAESAFASGEPPAAAGAPRITFKHPYFD